MTSAFALRLGSSSSILEYQARPVVSNNNPNPGQGPMEPQQNLRSGRGYNVLMNRGAPAEKLLQEWRMRRPYRRP